MNEFSPRQGRQQTAQIACVERQRRAQRGRSDPRVSADFVQRARLSERERAVEMAFAKQSEPRRVEAVELAQSGNLCRQSSHGIRVEKIVAFSNYLCSGYVSSEEKTQKCGATHAD